MSKTGTGYIVRCYPRHSDLEVEYTGTIYVDPDEAKIEWFQAKEDPAVDCSWVEMVCFTSNEDD